MRSYAQTSWLLILALVGYAVVAFILSSISPEAIRHTFFPESYLPLHLSFWFGNVCVFSWLLRSARRGVNVSLALGFVGFLWVRGVVVEPLGGVIAAVFPILIELVYYGYVFSLKKTANRRRSRRPTRQTRQTSWQ
jgi:cbb3-type cytochrome oxidase subunit 3